MKLAIHSSGSLLQDSSVNLTWGEPYRDYHIQTKHDKYRVEQVGLHPSHIQVGLGRTKVYRP